MLHLCFEVLLDEDVVSIKLKLVFWKIEVLLLLVRRLVVEIELRLRVLIHHSHRCFENVTGHYYRVVDGSHWVQNRRTYSVDLAHFLLQICEVMALIRLFVVVFRVIPVVLVLMLIL